MLFRKTVPIFVDLLTYSLLSTFFLSLASFTPLFLVYIDPQRGVNDGELSSLVGT